MPPKDNYFYTCVINQKRYVIPGHMAGGIQRYLEYGINPGSFLTAVICNNLKEAVMYADDTNLDNLPAYASYFYNEVDSRAWGSPEKMEKWIESRAEVRATAMAKNHAEAVEVSS